MKTRYLWTILSVFLLYLGGCIPTHNTFIIPPFVKQTLTKKALPAIVYLEMTDIHGKSISSGLGFFVSPIHILTNLHVVAWTAAGTAKSVDKTQTFPIRGIVAVDQENDLALLRVSIPNFSPLDLADSKKVQQGDRVYVVVANLFQQEHFVTFFGSHISHISKQGDEKNPLMTISSSLSNSGLPVLNRKGKVIGVTSMKFTKSKRQDLYFIIPSEYVKTLRNIQGRVMTLAESKIYISSDTYFNRGNTKFRLRLFKDAISDYDTVIQLKPDFADAYFNRGLTKANLGQVEEAEQDFQIALKLATQAWDIELQNKIENALLKLK